MEPLA
jgi:hypothetical protein